MRSVIVTVAGKELRDTLRERALLVLAGSLTLLVIVSVLSATLGFHDQVAAYNAAVDQLRATGQPTDVLTMPQYSPLQMLRAGVEYLEILGAVLAIVLGYVSFARERRSRVLKLVLTRGVTRRQLVAGKLLGGAVVLAALTGAYLTLAGLAIWLIGGIPLAGAEVLKLAMAAVLAFAYLFAFLAFAAALTNWVRNPPTALVLGLVVWIVVVLVLPQIGDTMDVDNQVAGGLFTSLGLDKAAATDVMSQFGTYEWIRNATEVLSPTKHFERASFAILGIKDEFNGQPLGPIIIAKWPNILVTALTALATPLLAQTAFTRNAEIWRDPS